MRWRCTRAMRVALPLAAGCALLGGCRGDRSDKAPREFFPDMDKQARWNPQADTPFYENGSSARVPDPNTVAFGRASFDPVTFAKADWAQSYMQQREDLLGENDAIYLGRVGDDYVDSIPVPVTLDRIRRGQREFNIFCAACHGYQGDGKGEVAVQFIAPPANLHADLYTDPMQRTARDGYIFEVIRNGVRNMPGYAHSVGVQDAWNIVMYVRALQKSHAGSLDSVPQDQLDALMSTRPLPVGAPPAPAGDQGVTPADGAQGGGQ
ncbi:MAG: cytochrome c [Leptolyngbya sp. PLA3]|nr:MAG: cytochrome c [Cyanobacteria bacterium CYA]MCE7967749.1 cytochrome c [Leptolyngbya sp. PL-A3]